MSERETTRHDTTTQHNGGNGGNGGGVPPRHVAARFSRRSPARHVAHVARRTRGMCRGLYGGSSRRSLVDPASRICLSQRLSHACLSANGRTR